VGEIIRLVAGENEVYEDPRLSNAICIITTYIYYQENVYIEEMKMTNSNKPLDKQVIAELNKRTRNLLNKQANSELYEQNLNLLEDYLYNLSSSQTRDDKIKQLSNRITELSSQLDKALRLGQTEITLDGSLGKSCDYLVNEVSYEGINLLAVQPKRASSSFRASLDNEAKAVSISLHKESLDACLYFKEAFDMVLQDVETPAEALFFPAFGGKINAVTIPFRSPLVSQYVGSLIRDCLDRDIVVLIKHNNVLREFDSALVEELTAEGTRTTIKEKYKSLFYSWSSEKAKGNRVQSILFSLVYGRMRVNAVIADIKQYASSLVSPELVKESCDSAIRYLPSYSISWQIDDGRIELMKAKINQFYEAYIELHKTSLLPSASSQSKCHHGYLKKCLKTSSLSSCICDSN